VQVRAEAQRLRLRLRGAQAKAQVPRYLLGPLPEPILLLRLALWAVELALARSATPQGEVDTNGRMERGDFLHILRVNRASVRGIGDSRPYHSYCIEEAAVHVVHNFPDNVVVC
jgi:hypothetical protein